MSYNSNSMTPRHATLRPMLLTTTLAALAVPAVLPPCLAAQHDTLRLTLSEVLARVRGEHPVARAGPANVRAASARAADLARYPNPAIDIERATFSQADNVALLQPIRWPWESSALRDLGRAEVAVAEAQAKRDARAVALDAAQRFADGLRDAGAVALAIEAESLAQRGMQRALAARQLGQAGDLTVLQGQVTFDAARRARVSAEAERDASAAALGAVLALAPGTVIVFAGELGSIAPLAVLDSALALTAAADAEAALLAGEADRAAQAARLARARRWPEIALGPSASLEGKAVIGLSLGLGLPLWNRQGAAIRAGAAEREAALARLDARRRERHAAVVEATGTLARTGRELDALRTGRVSPRTRSSRAGPTSRPGLGHARRISTLGAPSSISSGRRPAPVSYCGISTERCCRRSRGDPAPPRLRTRRRAPCRLRRPSRAPGRARDDGERHRRPHAPRPGDHRGRN